jgi:hypothetical protein
MLKDILSLVRAHSGQQLEEALAYIRQKKEGLLPGRIEGG